MAKTAARKRAGRAEASSKPRAPRRAAHARQPLPVPPLDGDDVATGSVAPHSLPTARSIVALALGHVGEPYEFGARAPMAYPIWNGPWDCAEFASWCVYQATGILYGTQPTDDPIMADAYSGYWAEQAERDAATVSTADALRIEGACLLRKPRRKTIGHIAFSTGDGGTIEARGRGHGVARHTASGRAWDYGVLVPGVSYFLGEKMIGYRPPRVLTRVTTPLTRGPGIAQLQTALTALGFHPGPIDGIYGPQTAAAVTAFQVNRGLVPDGEVGNETLKALRAGAPQRRAATKEHRHA